jgi:hypothetical protein
MVATRKALMKIKQCSPITAQSKIEKEVQAGT